MEAWRDAGLEDAGASTTERLGVAMASGIGGVHDAARQLRHAAREGPAPGLAARRPDADAQRPGRQHQPDVGARAAVNTPVSACASGNEAIALAVDQIRLGRADVVVAGGTEAAIHPLPMAAFANMMALSKNATATPTTVSPAVGHRPRRVRARRGRRRARARVRGARPGPRRADLRRGARRRHHRRLPRHRPARPGRSRRRRGRSSGRWPRPRSAPTTSSTSTRTRRRPRWATSPRA